MVVRHRAAAALAAVSCLLASSVDAQTVAAVSAGTEDKGGSAYLKCDGQPNNYSGGEAAARLLGAVTLLGLLAPPREAADASKRVKGAGGVEACSQLIDGVKREGNPERRISLILARAVHQIEVKAYDAALADNALAEREASAAGLAIDPFWARSRGRSFGLIRAAALVRMRRAPEARATALATTNGIELAVIPMIGTSNYGSLLPEPSPAELRYLADLGRIFPVTLGLRETRLEEAGQFKEAADVGDAHVDAVKAINPEKQASLLLAITANDHALAGDRPGAQALATQARENAAKRRSAGDPEGDQSAIVEALDLHTILDMMASGDLKGARRLFAARSQWASVPFGQSLEVVRRLRIGASSDELIGGLAKTPEELWRERIDNERAELLAKDDDNKTLFRLIQATVPAKSYEAVSARIWKADGSKLVMKPGKTPDPGQPFDLLFLPAADPRVLPEAYMLHAALIAKSRGHQGFVIRPIVQNGIIAARISTGKLGNPGFAEPMFNEADVIIAALRPIIPDPATLKARTVGK